jgi:hypothetical protein
VLKRPKRSLGGQKNCTIKCVNRLSYVDTH